MIRIEFDRGRAPLYIFAMAFFSILVSLFFPVQITPFVIALFFYPVFFYYVRRQKFFEALLSILFWAAIHTLIITFFFTLFPGFIEGRIKDSAWVGKPVGLLVRAPVVGVTFTQFFDLFYSSFLVRFIDLIYSIVLAGLSGGALALVALVNSVNSSAIWAAQNLASSGFSAAILSIQPWAVACGLGQAMVIIGVSSLFFAKLEKRKPDWSPVIRFLILGFAFVALGVYLEVSMGLTWQKAFEAALAGR